MTTPPKTDRASADRALARIVDRHRRRGDDHPVLDSDDHWEVLEFLQRLGADRLLEDAAGNDVEDGLILKVYLWWRLEVAELRLLDAGEAMQLNRRRVGKVLGVRTGQGVVDRADRTRAKIGPEAIASEKTGRALRHAARRPPIPRDSGPAGEVRRTANDLVQARGDLVAAVGESIGEDLDDLQIALDRWQPGRPCPAELFNDLQLLLITLRTADLPSRLRVVVQSAYQRYVETPDRV